MSNIFKRTFILAFSFLLLFASYKNSYAQTGTCPGAGLTINTAIGCIPINDTNALMSFILGWAISVGGGVAFLLILFAGFQILTSGGNPQKTQAGKELLTAAVSGLLMIIFSAFLLRIIGVNVLGIFS